MGRRDAVESAEVETAPALPDKDEPQDWFHEGQRALWEASERTIIALCGTQGGKTSMLPWWLLRETQQCAKFIRENKLGRNAILIGPTMTLLQAQAIPALKQVWIEELKLGKWVDSPKPRLVVSPEGAERLVGEQVPITIRCAYASDPNNLESMTAYAAVWDEGGQADNKEVSYEAVRRRLLAATKVNHGRLLVTTTPYEWNWLKHRLVDRADVDESIRVINWPSWLNPSVSEEDCRRELEAGMPPWRWRMMYEGRYERPAGLIYDCFERGINTQRRFRIPFEWPLYVGVDFGPENTAAVVLAGEREWTSGGWGEATGKYFVITTYHAGEKRTAVEHVQLIQEKIHAAIEGGKASIPVGYGGSAGEDGWREAWVGAKLPVSIPPDSNVEVQIQTVWSAFKRGRLVIFDDLDSILREVDTYSREVDANGERTTKIANKSKFHRLDALRYIATAVLRSPIGKPAIEVIKKK